LAPCPCCGAETATRITPANLLAYLHVSPTEHRILSVLVRHYGKEVPSRTLIEAMYSEREDGGPDDGGNSFRVRTSKLRKKLRPFGYTIRGFWGAARLQQV
jgi:DNA-binding response OmpR family regulator